MAAPTVATARGAATPPLAKLFALAFALAVAGWAPAPALAAPAPALAAPAPALAAPADVFAAPADVFVEVNPSTVEAGRRVAIRASCPDNSESATVRSDAFGRLTVEPRDDFLVRTVTIPRNQDPRSFTVRLSCPDGQTATATLHVVAGDRPARGPATGYGGTAGENPGGALIAIGLLTAAAGVAVGLFALGRRRARG